MERVAFVEYKGKKILHVDMSNCMENEVLNIIEQARKIITAQPEKSLLMLTDVTHARYNASVVMAMQMYTRGNRQYVKSSAVVGINAIKKIIFNKIVEASERQLNTFETVEKAKNWLASI